MRSRSDELKRRIYEYVNERKREGSVVSMIFFLSSGQDVRRQC